MNAGFGLENGSQGAKRFRKIRRRRNQEFWLGTGLSRERRPGREHGHAQSPALSGITDHVLFILQSLTRATLGFFSSASRRIFAIQYTASMPAAMKISIPVRIPKIVLDMSDSTMLAVEDVEEDRHGQRRESVDQGSKQRDCRDQPPSDAHQVQDKIDYQQNCQQYRSCQRKHGGALQSHGCSMNSTAPGCNPASFRSRLADLEGETLLKLANTTLC